MWFVIQFAFDQDSYNTTITVRCEKPTAPSNGDLDTVTSTTEGATVTFQCNPGYTPTGEMNTTCMADLTWNPEPDSFVCSPLFTHPPPVDCGVPDPPVNGSFVVSLADTTQNSVIFYRCDEGLFPMGDLPSICNASGVWNPNPRDQFCATEQCMF